jgi:formylmethanofuran dehydrogenase subunit E
MKKARRSIVTATDGGSWVEHELCARCGAPLGEDYRQNSLGLRFCAECFGSTIEEKERERRSEIYLKGRCASCGGSLINGYRQSKLGVIYCIRCFEGRDKP